MAILFHYKSLLVFVEIPELIDPIIDQIKQIRQGHESDFLLLKYLVKTMTGYASDFEVSNFDPRLLRVRVDEARVLEKELS